MAHALPLGLSARPLWVKMSRTTRFVGTADLPQTVCPSLKRRLTLDITARVTRRGAIKSQHVASSVAATALQAMHGIDIVAAVTVLAEIGNQSRFFMPQRVDGVSRSRTLPKSSTGDTVNSGGIAKAGNGRARRILVEAA